MSQFSFRPQLEEFGDRCLPSGMLSINDVAHMESISGQTAFRFTVSLSQPSDQPVSASYATADGTATAAEGDYVPTSGTLHFTKGQTAATITVMVNGSSVAEPDETFLVKLSKPSHAAIADGTGIGTIQELAPTARPDGTGTYQLRTAGGNVLRNDRDPAGGGLTVGTVNGGAANVGTQITLPSGALLTVNADGWYAYDPNGAFDYLGDGQSANDSFTYTATDALGTPSNTATVTITVRYAVLTAVDDDNSTQVDSSGDAPPFTGNVLSNDIDPTGAGLTVTAVNGSAASVGTMIQLASGALLTVYANGYYTYDPNGAFDSLAGTSDVATDCFTYTVTDSRGSQSTATVTIDLYGNLYYWWDPNGPNTGPYPIY